MENIEEASSSSLVSGVALEPFANYFLNHIDSSRYEPNTTTDKHRFVSISNDFNKYVARVM